MRNLFAIADLHLSSGKPKPMDVFGPRWVNHVERVENSWRQNVRPDDIVLIAGDISWAMNLSEVRPDFEWMAALPGDKVILEGQPRLLVEQSRPDPPNGRRGFPFHTE